MEKSLGLSSLSLNSVYLGPKNKSSFQVLPFGSLFQNFIIKYIFVCKSEQTRRQYSSIFGQTKWINRVAQCAEDVFFCFCFLCFFFSPHTSLNQYLEKNGKNQTDEISFIACTMQKLRKKTEAMLLWFKLLIWRWGYLETLTSCKCLSRGEMHTLVIQLNCLPQNPFL